MNDKNDNGIPSVEIDVRKTFDIDIDMKVMGFKEPNEYVPTIDNSYKFDKNTKEFNELAILIEKDPNELRKSIQSALVENKTFLFVTHSIEEAVYVSDQIAILLPRPSRVMEVIRPTGFRHKDVNSIRRDPEYLDIVDRIWASLKSYVE